MVEIDDEVFKKYLEKLVGKYGLEIIKSMPDGEFTDMMMVERSGYNLNLVRKVLSILHEKNIARYKRVRDKESSWLNYYWTIDTDSIELSLKNELNRLYNILNEKLKFEENNIFYVCSAEIPCGRYTFDFASDHYFICPVCEKDLTVEDNTEITKKLRKRVEEIEKLKII